MFYLQHITSNSEIIGVKEELADMGYWWLGKTR